MTFRKDSFSKLIAADFFIRLDSLQLVRERQMSRASYFLEIFWPGVNGFLYWPCVFQVVFFLSFSELLIIVLSLNFVFLINHISIVTWNFGISYFSWGKRTQKDSKSGHASIWYYLNIYIKSSVFYGMWLMFLV